MIPARMNSQRDIKESKHRAFGKCTRTKPYDKNQRHMSHMRNQLPHAEGINLFFLLLDHAIVHQNRCHLINPSQ